MSAESFDFYDFFAGGGMARLGLGARWRCVFANDNCAKKAQAYRENFPPAHELSTKNIEDVALKDLPGRPMLAWASFPCQDLSLAGDRRGLAGERSSTFWPFWRLMEGMVTEGRAVPLLVLENVVGAVTSHGGRDFQAILSALSEGGYTLGPLVIDAVHFVPQSRPRLFIVGVADRCRVPLELLTSGPCGEWHPRVLRDAYRRLPRDLRDAWLWWRMPDPPGRVARLSDILEDDPAGVEWHKEAETERLLGMMSQANLEKVRRAQRTGQRVVGTIYKRTRPAENGGRVQRAEVRFDEVSGCLRTPIGGSSRQTVIVVQGSIVRSRLLSPREAARLMGVPETYRLPEKYNEAYHLMGDGLAVPAVSWLERHLLRSLAEANAERQREAA